MPDGAITKAPPEYDEETQSILFKDGNWEVFDILVGESYFEADGTEHIIQTKNFTLPEAVHTSKTACCGGRQCC